MDREEEFRRKLLSTYRIEAQEHVQAIAAGLLELEKEPAADLAAGIIETIYRDAHSLKGASRAVNLRGTERICQSLESIFAALKKREITATADLFTALHRAVEAMAAMVPQSDGTDSSFADSRLEPLLDTLSRALRGEPVTAGEKQPQAPETVSPATAETAPPATGDAPQAALRLQAPVDSVRISLEKMDSLLLQAEEMRSAKLLAEQRTRDADDVLSDVTEWRKKWAGFYPIVRELHRRIEQRERRGRGPGLTESEKELLDFTEWTHDFVIRAGDRIRDLRKSLASDHHTVGLMTDTLLDDVRKIMMLPVSTLLNQFPKLVRDLSRDQGKEASMFIQGGEIEIDRRILEGMRTPLIHLLRNAVDHGIEKPPARAAAKKAARGNIRIAVTSLEGNRVELLLSDDGAGFDAPAIRASALKKGVISETDEARIDDRDVLASLIYRSGVSTSPIITDLSGRGLGLAIVKEKVEALGGHLRLETTPGKGSRFRITLPINLAAFRGILVSEGNESFILATTNVERVLRLKAEEVKTVESRETVQTGDATLPLFGLGDLLGIAKGENAPSHFTVLVLAALDQRIALHVDAVLGEQEVVVKPFSPQLSRVRNVSAATVLGSGRVVPVLNAMDLVRSSLKHRPSVTMGARTEAAKPEEKKKVLIVEDSITSRMLLKNILESSGYRVKVAVDGMEGYTILRQEPFDIVVSDVDMPRMNGFDLTAKIRGDRKLADLPVVLVTSLDSRDDRERGIDVGANAYIVKSSFDQSNLLEIVERLS
jgi:two-component system chemotaxis sensor kinase CheA